MPLLLPPIMFVRVVWGLIVLGARLATCLAVVAIMDVATMGAAVPIVIAGAVRGLLVGLVPSREWLVSIEVCVWLVGIRLLLYLAPGLLLPVSSTSSASATASTSLALPLLILHWLLELCLWRRTLHPRLTVVVHCLRIHIAEPLGLSAFLEGT